MGNASSGDLEESGLEVVSQGETHLWTIVLEGSEDGKGEGVCVFTRSPGEGAVAALCKTATEHLRVLRHPNILKFLGCEVTPECITLVTEPVVPLLRTLNETSLEGMVMGWRCVGAGLSFLHDNVGMSHNNLSLGCVYVNTMDSHWKVGGLEIAAKYKDINSKFLSSMSGIRSAKAVPPEDKANSIPVESVPIHARDVWALGNFILAIIEEAGLEAELQDETFQYINDLLLSQNPLLRPPVSEILLQPWMSNVSSLLTDFLSNFTLKSKQEKDAFFCSLPEQLHSLSPQVLADNVVPLLVSPLIMADPLARDTLWKHLLVPVSAQHPRRLVFNSSVQCPLLDEDLFKAHLLPLLLNLMESRDLHVRVLLLRHLGGFISLCDQKDLVGVVLPEVLVGLKDNSDEMVAATLHALAELVPYVGAELVMGTSRKRIFTDAQPREESLAVGSISCEGPAQSSSSPALQHTATATSSQPTRSRDERMKRMREKREEQRRKRLEQKKMGLALAKDHAEFDATPAFPLAIDSPQYSPSISHDEVEPEITGESGTSNSGSDMLSRRLMAASISENIAKESDSSGKEEEDAEEREEDWEEKWSDMEDLSSAKFGGSWTVQDSVPNSIPEQKLESGSTSIQSTGLKSSKLVLKSKSEDKKESSKKKKVNLKKQISGSKQGGGNREEEKLAFAQVEEELDLFADMAPKFPTSSVSLFPGSPTLHKTASAGPAQSALEKKDSDGRPSSSSLMYQQEESTGGGWGEDDWGENF